jgi:16S rRNA U1498 N3-methylase RsmE
MPYKVRKKRGHDCFKVTNIETQQVMAECATREKAYAQVRLLEDIDKEKKQPVKIHTLSDEDKLETKDKTKKIIKVKKKKDSK